MTQRQLRPYREPPNADLDSAANLKRLQEDNEKFISRLVTHH